VAAFDSEVFFQPSVSRGGNPRGPHRPEVDGNAVGHFMIERRKNPLPPRHAHSIPLEGRSGRNSRRVHIRPDPRMDKEPVAEDEAKDREALHNDHRIFADRHSHIIDLSERGA